MFLDERGNTVMSLAYFLKGSMQKNSADVGCLPVPKDIQWQNIGIPFVAFVFIRQ